MAKTSIVLVPQSGPNVSQFEYVCKVVFPEGISMDDSEEEPRKDRLDRPCEKDMSRGSSPCSFCFRKFWDTPQCLRTLFSTISTEFSAQLGRHQRLEPRRRFADRHDVSLRFFVFLRTSRHVRAQLGSSLAALFFNQSFARANRCSHLSPVCRWQKGRCKKSAPPQRGWVRGWEII